MYQLSQLFSFHISKEERQAMDVLKAHEIIISRFLRKQLRQKAQELMKADSNESNKMY